MAENIEHDNVGVKAASGKLIMCLDSDDMLTDECVERAKKVWNNNRLKKCKWDFSVAGRPFVSRGYL